MLTMPIRVLAAGLVICGAAHAQVEIPVLQKPIQITASYDSKNISSFGECRKFTPIYKISSPKRTLIEEPEFVSACTESNEVAIKKAVNVYNPFITIRSDCSGNAWGCGERILYTYTDDDVIRLGRIDDYLFALGKTLFLKHFDWYEVTDYTGHSWKPIRIVLGVVDRHLVIDPELTWIFNHDKIEENTWRPGRDGCGRDQEASNQSDCYSQLLYTLQLAKLTGRIALYKQSLKTAKIYLYPDVFENIKKMAESITPESVQKWLDRSRR